ncbi:MAG: hypothetical protein R2788_05765 [Saprospiraceae bacterium]
MRNSKLIRLLKSFDFEETKQLVLFAKSPLFNDGGRPLKVQLLLEFLTGYYPYDGNLDLTKEHVFRSVFGETIFNEKKLSKLASETLHVVRRFIATCLSVENSETDYWLEQARYYRRRNLFNEFKYAIAQLEKLQRKSFYKKSDYFFTQFNLESEKFRFSVLQNDKKGDINLPDVIHFLDTYYVLMKLEYCSYLQIQSSFVQLDTSKSFLLLKEVLQYAENQCTSIPMVSVFYHAMNLLLDKNSSAEKYRAFKTILKENENYLEANMLRAFHSYLRNYLAARYNEGSTDCLAELLQLYKDHISQGTVYQEEGYIPAGILQSAVNIALKLGDHDWAIKFLKQHRQKITGADDSEAIYHFNLANCFFHNQEYEKTRDILINFQFREAYYKLAARRLEIKLYHDTKSPLLDSRIDAFKIFVHELKSSMPSDMITPNNQFADLMRQLLSPRTYKNEERINKLIKKLVSLRAVAEREWLHAKFQELLP